MSDTSTTPPRTRVTFSLSTKLTLLAAVLALSPLPVVGWLLTTTARDAVERQVAEVQFAVADQVAASLTDSLTTAADGVDTVARLLTSDLEPDVAVNAALRVVEGEESLDHVAIFDAGGGLMDVLREPAAEAVTVPEVMDDALGVRAAEENGAFGAVLIESGEPRIPVLLPIRPAPGESPSGFAASWVSLAPLQDRVRDLAARRFTGTPNAMLVVDAERRVVATSEPEGASGQVTLDAHPALETVHGPAAFRTPFSQGGTYHVGDADVYATVVSVPSLDLAVLVQLPADVVLAPVHQMRWAVLSIAGVVVLLALLIGVFGARLLVRPLDRLRQLAERLGRRDFGGAVTVRSGDELAVLGDALSRASTDLAESEQTIREQEAVRADLGRYLPNELVERVVAREQDMSLGGTRREITVLFADVVRFTPLTEQNAPEEVVTILNELFTILTEIVFRHGGTVDKFIGDCVMAMWGAPEPQADHATRALAAAEDMLRWLETGNATWRARFGVEIELAIGINTGEAVVGNIGSESRMAYTAIGDAVNVAARLEAVARPRQILITEATLQAADEGFETIDAGEQEVGGRILHLHEVRA